MEKADIVIDRLLASDEPSVVFKTRVDVLGNDPESAGVKRLQKEIKASSRVEQLLGERDEAGRPVHHAYAKWEGAHWTLASMADIGYPSGDEALIPLREQVFEWLLSDEHMKQYRVLDGRVRKCASMEGNALYYLLTLGLADERIGVLVDRLHNWQWPDGGWNCDRHPEAYHSSYMESLIPLRGLALHAQITGNQLSRQAAERAAEIFLKRKLYKRQSDGKVITDDFVMLHYPCYWHYDILFGLKVLAEAGFIDDPRCQDALDLLESKRLPDGGWPAEKKYYRATDQQVRYRSLVNWGGTSKRRMNEWVTADALYVLRAAGRF